MAKKHKLSACFSSESVEHETPQWLFDELNKEFNFNIDVCANKHNCKVAKFFSKEDNGLLKIWKGYKAAWMNPPYARGITGQWVRKAYASAIANQMIVVALLPVRTDQPWWFNYIWHKKGRCPHTGITLDFIEGRLRFNENDFMTSGAPFPSIIVIFDGR